MQKRDMAFIGIAGVCGLFGFFFFLSAFKTPPPKKVKPSFNCVVAAEAIPKGQPIGEKLISVGGPFEMDNSNDVFLQLSEAAGYVPVVDIAKGDIIKRSNVKKFVEPPAPVKKKPRRSVLPIPKGVKVLQLAGDQVDSFSKGLKLGAFADIFGNVLNEAGKIERRCIIRGAQIVMLEEDLNTSSVLTLAVSLPPKSAEVLIKGMSEGKLRLVTALDPGGKVTYYRYGYAEIIRGISREKTYQVIQESEPMENALRLVSESERNDDKNEESPSSL